MTPEKEDYTILHAGYMRAIDDVLKIVDDEVLKYKIIRKSKIAFKDNIQFEGTITKYYLKEQNIGIIVFESIYDLKGFMINIDEGTYNILKEDELLFAKENWQNIYQETFVNEAIMEERYKYFLNQWKKAEN